jgi:general secretion pathway protein E
MILQPSLPVTDSFRPEYLEYYGILPLDVADGKVRVAVAGSPPPEVLEDLGRTYAATVDLVVAEPQDIIDTVRQLFSSAQSTHALVRSLDLEAPDPGRERALEADARDLVSQPPVVRYVNLLIREAFEARASDIHLEASDGGPVVRFRVDGVLSPATAPPLSIQDAVISRLKLIADLDIAERRVPQDGRTRIRLDHQELDLRVSTVPTMFGESMVLRLLDRGVGPTSLESLGMGDETRSEFASIIARPHGIVLATGPTGSGKTTTLYAALQLRDVTREKIITVEDPIEYHLAGVTQVPVNRKAGMTFAAGLRSILRQDPDVIMVGEMRDPETARVAVQAAMTGHLVLSTVHTNDAASAISRLVDLGIEPYLVAATLQGILAQRLVRRICDHCGEWIESSRSLLDLSPVVEHGRKTRLGRGCALCRHTGYVGRVGLFELLTVSEALRAQIARTPDVQATRRMAEEEGMTTLREDGLRKVLGGLTSVQEMLRAITV